MAKHTLHLIPVHKLETDAQLRILEIRNNADVRKMMYTDQVIGTNEHLLWISRLKTDRSQITLGILDEDTQPIGVFSFNAINEKNKRCDWGFYLAPASRGHGIGSAVEVRMLEFAFETLSLEKLDGTVVEGNDAVLTFYKRFGFEEEGFRTSQLERDGRRIGVHLLGLQKHSWIQNKSALQSERRQVLEQFTIEIDWQPEERHLTPIDQIEAARAKNNVNWMNILRIAVEKSPVNAKQIIADIRELDQQISALTAKIELEP